MPFEVVPALLLAIVLAMVIVGVRRSLRGRGATQRSEASATDRPAGHADPAAHRAAPAPEGIAGVVDASIAMWVVRRLRAGRGGAQQGADSAVASDIAQPAADEVAYRIGAVGAVRPTPPTRLVAVGSHAQPRVVPPASPRLRPPAPPPRARPLDSRLLLWRDTAVVALAIGFIAIIGTTFQPFASRGGVLAETFAPGSPAAATLPPGSGSVASPAPVVSPSSAAVSEPPAPTARPTATATTGGPRATPRPTATRTPSPTAKTTPPPTGSPTPTPTESPEPIESPTPTPTESPSPTPSEELTPPP